MLKQDYDEWIKIADELNERFRGRADFRRSGEIVGHVVLSGSFSYAELLEVVAGLDKMRREMLRLQGYVTAGGEQETE